VIGGLHTTPPSAEAAGPALHGVAQASFVDALEAQGHGAAGAAVCSPRSDDDAAGANAASLASLLRQFRLRIEDPLLPLPDPKVVRRRLFHVSQSSVRRSRRLAAKGCGISASTVKRAQRILMQKLGVCREGERITDSQLQEYKAIFASPLGPEQLAAIAALFGLSASAQGEPDLVEVAAA
jgi:hypothetical protein